MIGEILHPRIMMLNSAPASKEALLNDMAQLLEQQGYVQDKKAYLEAVYERETLGSTYIGHGVAIPHGKSPAVTKTGVAFARMAEGLDYDGQGELAHLIFMIAAPAESDNEHLKVLAMLARKLMHESNRCRLMEAACGLGVIKVFEEEKE